MQIELGKEEAALVFSDSGVTLYVPKATPVTAHAIMATVISILLEEETELSGEFCDVIQRAAIQFINKVREDMGADSGGDS